MIPRVIDAEYVKGFTIHVRFSDGVEGDVDLEGELDGEIFAPLKDQSYFRQFKIHPDLHTLTWPNGADLAPEFLHDKIRVPA